MPGGSSSLWIDRHPGKDHGLTGESKGRDRKSTRLNSSHTVISYAVFCLKKKNVLLVLELGSDAVVLLNVRRELAVAELEHQGVVSGLDQHRVCLVRRLACLTLDAGELTA